MAIGAIGDSRCISKIGGLLDEEEDSDKIWVYALALGKIDNLDVYPYLLNSLNKSSYNILRVLKYKNYHNHQNILPTLIELLYHDDIHVIDTVLGMLCQSENKEALKAVKEWEESRTSN